MNKTIHNTKIIVAKVCQHGDIWEPVLPCLRPFHTKNYIYTDNYMHAHQLTIMVWWFIISAVIFIFCPFKCLRSLHSGGFWLSVFLAFSWIKIVLKLLNDIVPLVIAAGVDISILMKLDYYIYNDLYSYCPWCAWPFKSKTFPHQFLEDSWWDDLV